MDETGFNSVVKNADVLITGEGSMDRQSLRGKTPVAVARRAQDYDVDLIFGLAGQLSGEYEALYPLFDFLLSTVKRPVDLSDHLEQFEDPLRSTVRDIGRILCLLDRG
jgi:glycerate kinase